MGHTAGLLVHLFLFFDEIKMRKLIKTRKLMIFCLFAQPMFGMISCHFPFFWVLKHYFSFVIKHFCICVQVFVLMTNCLIMYLQGDPVNLSITVTRLPNYPIDLYYLMDLSRSMTDDLLKLKTLAKDLCTALVDCFAIVSMCVLML